MGLSCFFFFLWQKQDKSEETEGKRRKHEVFNLAGMHAFLRHDGKMHGRGTYKYAEGDVYQGEWKDDKRHGKGVVTYAEGLVIRHETISQPAYTRTCCIRDIWYVFSIHMYAVCFTTIVYVQIDVPDYTTIFAQVSARGSVVEKFEGDWVNGKMHGQGKRFGC